MIFTAYGASMLKGGWTFSLNRAKDILLCGSVIYLIEKDIHTSRIDVINLVSSILAVIIVVLTVYVFMKLKRWKFYLEFENYEVVSITFITSFLIGLSAVMSEYKLGSLINITILALNLYVIHTTLKWLKPLV